ncbi:MAG TPA: formate dehydrogenase accessory sulfurtransferase FdhD [Chroococcales cyanobacterium]
MNDRSEKVREITALPIRSFVGDQASELEDLLSVEEPLEIRIAGGRTGAEPRSVAVTMRTPGDDDELAVGFLYTEGIISGFEQISGIHRRGCNVIEVRLAEPVEIDPAQLDRHSFIASSCGVCGKKSIAAVAARRKYHPRKPFPAIIPEIIHKLPDALKLKQKSFGATGGIHAAGLFDGSGNLIIAREDVGRHNALDKLIGACAAGSNLPLDDRIILVSGRASFELVQKAAHAGATILAAVGAPSSLAVELAQSSGMTLLGFVRGNRFNLYTAPDAVQAPAFC